MNKMAVCLFATFSYTITYFCVIITQTILPFKLLTQGENIDGTTLPVSQLEQGCAWRH